MKCCLLGMGLLLVLACAGRWLMVANNWLPDDEAGWLKTAQSITIMYEADGKVKTADIARGPELNQVMGHLRLTREGDSRTTFTSTTFTSVADKPLLTVGPSSLLPAGVKFIVGFHFPGRDPKGIYFYKGNRVSVQNHFGTHVGYSFYANHTISAEFTRSIIDQIEKAEGKPFTCE